MGIAQTDQPGQHQHLDGELEQKAPSDSRASRLQDASSLNGSSARAKSPTKTLPTLESLEKPVGVEAFDFARADEQLPDDVRELFYTIYEFMEGSGGFLPREVENEIRALCGKRVFQHHFRPRTEQGSKEHSTESPQTSDAATATQAARDKCLLELDCIDNIVKETLESGNLKKSEPSWNEDVHKVLLRLAVTDRPGLKVENITLARLLTGCVPRLLGGGSVNKMVDYAIVFRPAEGVQLRESIRALVLGQPVDSQSISPTPYAPLKYSPTGILVETKTPEGSFQEALDQLCTWVSALHIRMQQLRKGILVISMPLLICRGSHWTLYFACDKNSQIVSLFPTRNTPKARWGEANSAQKVVGPIDIGSTSTHISAYRLLNVIRLLLDWMETTFVEWIQSEVLQVPNEE